MCPACGLHIEYPADADVASFPCPECAADVPTATATPVSAEDSFEQAKAEGQQKLLEQIDRISVEVKDEASFQTILRAAIIAFSNETKANPAAVPQLHLRMGWMQLSVLDATTTETCVAYAFSRWDEQFNPVDDSLPFAGGCPRHEGCRSVIVPVNLDEPVRENFTFADWLAQFRDDEKMAVFGAAAWQAYGRGEIPAAKLIEHKQELLMTLAKGHHSEKMLARKRG